MAKKKRRVLTAGEVSELRRLHQQGHRIADLARYYRVHRGIVSRIVAGKTHREVPTNLTPLDITEPRSNASPFVSPRLSAGMRKILGHDVEEDAKPAAAAQERPAPPLAHLVARFQEGTAYAVCGAETTKAEAHLQWASNKSDLRELGNLGVGVCERACSRDRLGGSRWLTR